MSYTATTQGADANPAATFMTTLDTILVAAGFTAVETWTSGNYTAIIYKSPAASNVQGADWYLNVLRSSNSSSVVSFGVAEAWNTSTKKFTSYAPANITTQTPTATFTYNDATGVLPNGTLMMKGIVLSTSSFPHWISATCNRVIVGTRVSSTNYGIYAGLYDDLLPAAISPFPLCVLDTAGSNGGSTREPGATTSTANAFGLKADPGSWGLQYGSADVYQGKVIASRAGLWSYRGAVGGANGLRGLMKDAVQCVISSAVNGDTLAVTDSVGVTKTYTRISEAAAVHIWADQGV
jgi:hypothetical protein